MQILMYIQSRKVANAKLLKGLHLHLMWKYVVNCVGLVKKSAFCNKSSNWWEKNANLL